MNEIKLNKVAELMTATIALAATRPEAVRKITTEMVRDNVLRATVQCADSDLPLILGGRGANAKAVREIGVHASPAGCYVELHLQSDAGGVDDQLRERPRIKFGKAPQLEAAEKEAIREVIRGWHVATGCPLPAIKTESTGSADIFLVQGRELNSTVMKGLRRIVGWSAKIRGRHGFIEWEAAN